MTKTKWKQAIYNGILLNDWIVNEYGVLKNKNTGEIKTGRPNNPKRNDFHMRVSIKHKLYYIHRIVAESFIPNPNNYPVVRHKNDDPTNNHYSNLEWGTHSDNTNDAIRNGKIVYDNNRNYVKNENHPQAILTNNDVEKVCLLLKKGTPISDIGKIFGVDRNVILHIYKHNSWKDISSKYGEFPEQKVYDPISDKTKLDIITCLLNNNNATASEICKKLNIAVDNKTKCFIRYQKHKIKNVNLK